MAIKPIRNSDDLQQAKVQLAALMARTDAGRISDDIEIFSTLIEQFEQKHFTIEAPDAVTALKFRMEEKGLTARQLEPFIGSRARVSEVLTGKRHLSIDMIRSLHDGLGIPYEALLSKRRHTPEVSSPALERLNDLGIEIQDRKVLAFITGLNGKGNASPALLRKTRTQRAALKTDQSALFLWQAAVLQKSHSPAATYHPSKFTYDALRKIARLSPKEQGPRRAISKLAELGISVVIMPALPGTFLDGAAMADKSGNPIIGLTLRHDRIDNFWYTLLHECAHVALHYDHLVKEHAVFVDDMEIQSEDKVEREADDLAREALIPLAILNQVTWGPNTSYEDLSSLVARARVHLSVVAGRWQRDHQNYKRFAKMTSETRCAQP